MPVCFLEQRGSEEGGSLAVCEAKVCCEEKQILFVMGTSEMCRSVLR